MNTELLLNIYLMGALVTLVGAAALAWSARGWEGADCLWLPAVALLWFIIIPFILAGHLLGWGDGRLRGSAYEPPGYRAQLAALHASDAERMRTQPHTAAGWLDGIYKEMNVK